MIKEEAPKPKRKKSEHRVTFRESAAMAFQDVLRTAARNNREIALSIEGKVVMVDAKKLRDFLVHRHNGNSIENEILQYAKVNNP
jgi:hypothetical protein